MISINNVYEILRELYENVETLGNSLPDEDMLLEALPSESVLTGEELDYAKACRDEYEYIIEVLDDIKVELESHRDFLNREINRR